MKYIDAEKLIAEIERRIAAYQKNFDKADNKIAKLSTDGRIASLKEILPFITSLQQEQPEVDLEKEIEEYFALWRQGASDEGCVNANSQFVSLYDCTQIARYFYELGLNARKNE